MLRFLLSLFFVTPLCNRIFLLTFHKNIQGLRNHFPLTFFMAAAIRLWQGVFGVWELFPMVFLTPLWTELDDPTLKTAESNIALEHCSCCYWLNCTGFFWIMGPVFAVQTRPWLFSECRAGDVMLLQKVGSACAKIVMAREPSWLWSNITHFINTVLQFYFH